MESNSGTFGGDILLFDPVLDLITALCGALG